MRGAGRGIDLEQDIESPHVDRHHLAGPRRRLDTADHAGATAVWNGDGADRAAPIEDIGDIAFTTGLRYGIGWVRASAFEHASDIDEHLPV